MKIQQIESPRSEKSGAFGIRKTKCLRAGYETAPDDSGKTDESRPEQQHARWLGDVDVGITLGGGRKDGDGSRRHRGHRLRLNRCGLEAIRLARDSRRTRGDDAEPNNDHDGENTNKQRTRIHVIDQPRRVTHPARG
jgi:hypothetical protein